MTGEEKAWEILRNLDPQEVCRKAGVYYDGKNKNYILSSLGMDFIVLPQDREIKGTSTTGENLIRNYRYFLNLSILFYLINAKDVPLSGKLVQTVNLKGGDIFFRGTHILPLDKIAERYGNDKSGFIEKGRRLGGRILNYGDVAVELLPVPRIPVTLILWLPDDEFPARADLLFDSTCQQHLPLDILWSVAMLSVLAML